MAEAKAIGYLELDIKGFTAALETAKKALAVFGVSFAAFKSAEFWKDHIKGAIDLGNALYVAGQRMGGFDPGKLLVVRKAFESTGLSAEEASSQINEMLNSHRDFSTFFKGGQQGFGGAMGTAQKNYGSEGAVISKYAEQFAKVEQTIASIVEKGQTFFLSMSAQFLEPLYALLNALNQVDLAGIGESLGSAVDKVANTLIGLFAQGKLTETFSNGLVVAAETFVNYLVGGARALADGLAGIITNINWGKFALGFGEVLVGALTKALSSLSSGLITVAKYFGAGIATVLEAAVSKMMGPVNKVLAPIFHVLGKSYTPASFKAGSFDENLQAVNSAFKPADDYLGKLSGAGQSVVNAGVKNISESPGKFDFKFQAANMFSDLPERSKALAASLASAEKAGEALGKIPPVVKANWQALGPQQPLHIIADSLARVGGGGNYVRATLSISERQLMQQTEIQRQILLATQATANAVGDGAKSGQDPKMGRE